MDDGKLYSLDRIEDGMAVLIDEERVDCVIPLTDLPAGACEGKMYRRIGESYTEDSAAEQARRQRIQALQNRLRRRQK